MREIRTYGSMRGRRAEALLLLYYLTTTQQLCIHFLIEGKRVSEKVREKGVRYAP